MRRTYIVWTVASVSVLTACFLTSLTEFYRFNLLQNSACNTTCVDSEPPSQFRKWKKRTKFCGMVVMYLNLNLDVLSCVSSDKEVCISRCYKVG